MGYVFIYVYIHIGKDHNHIGLYEVLGVIHGAI